MRVKKLRKRPNWVISFLRESYQKSIDHFGNRLKIYENKLTVELFKELDINSTHEQSIKKYFERPEIKEIMEISKDEILHNILIGKPTI